MRDRENSIAPLAVLLFTVAAAPTGCRKAPPPAPDPAQAQPPSPAEALLADVVDPWTWPRAAGASDRERAIEDIGPYERARPGDAASPPVNPNARYWTALAGIAWNRDVDIDFDREPVDLDDDGHPDALITRHIHAKGGVLANPALFGLTPTPDDPRGRIGRVSASTGVLGLREALRPDGTPSGEVGMTCWLCHGGAVDSRVVLGVPGRAFDYGLLLATARVLDDANVEAVAFRTARGFPSGRTVRARLLLAGPGRQDLTGEFGLDVTVPGYHSARYPGTARVRQGTRGIVNPISVPGIMSAPGLALENWSGSEDASGPWLERLVVLAGRPRPEVLAAFALPAADRAAARRALLFDLRNLGTLGLQQDSFPGLLWADAIYGHARLSAAATAAVPPMYGTVAVRRAVEAETTQWRSAQRVAAAAAGESVARGRAIFAERVVGTIANRQILKRSPRAYAAARLEGPMLAAIDGTKPLDATLAVRCADCHSAAPLETVRPLAENPPPLGRCTHCHLTHVGMDEWRPAPSGTAAASERQQDAIVAIADLGVKIGAGPAAEVTFCAACHENHRDFGPMVWSSSRLFPFDADGDGDAQGDPAADRRAGGIGTDPLLAFDVPIAQRPFSLDVAVIPDVAHARRISRARTGVSWVRASPLTALKASAPYLHNGSVPTLRALLEPAARRPVTFPLGTAGFVFDTRLPGNGNQGHEFGTALSPGDRQDLLAYLETL